MRRGHHQSTKLLIVIGSLNSGGAEHHVLKIAPELIKQGFTVSIFLLANRGVLAEAAEQSGIRVIGPWIEANTVSHKILALPFRLARLLLTTIQLFCHLIWTRPHIAHFFLPASYIVGGPVAILAGISRKIMSRRSLNHYQSSWYLSGAIERFLHQRMDAIIGNSQAVVQQLLEEEGAPHNKVGLIYNGIGMQAPLVAKDTKQIREEFDIEERSIVVTVVANLIPYKGHVDIIEGLALVSDQLPENLVIALAGRDDGLGQLLRAKSAELGMSDKFRILGSIPNVHELLKASDIFVLASHQEGFSNAVLEAMQAGLGIVVTNVGGNGEAITDGKTGLVVAAKAPHELGNAILRMIKDQELRIRMGAAARIRSQKLFSMERCVARYIDLYEGVIEERPLDTIPSLRPVQTTVAR